MFASDKLLKLLYPDYHLSPEEYLIFNISILDQDGKIEINRTKKRHCNTHLSLFYTSTD